MTGPALLLIRHGETQAEFQGRCYGSSDVGLSPLGREQMRGVAEWTRPWSLEAIYASPRLRCKEGAEIIGARHGCAIVIDAGFAELDFGECEGHTYDEIAASHPELYREWMAHPAQVQFPGGESLPQMRDRVLAALAKLRAAQPEANVALIAHGGVNRIILAETLGMPSENLFRIAQRYAAINVIRYVEGEPVVELLNAAI
jgi:alpha-ribazole phosphatase/probable phosphoglycerate mutase